MDARLDLENSRAAFPRKWGATPVELRARLAIVPKLDNEPLRSGLRLWLTSMTDVSICIPTYAAGAATGASLGVLSRR